MSHFTANSEQTVTEQLSNGTIITGISSAIAMSNISYEDAHDKAIIKANNAASTNVLNNIALYEIFQNQKTIYSAETIASESAVTHFGDTITSNATGSATSTISIADAQNKALALAQEKAYSSVQHDVNIINSIKGSGSCSCSGSCSSNVKFEHVESNNSYELTQPGNAFTTLVIIVPKATPFELLKAINSSEKFADINHNIKILNNGEEINVLKCMPLVYINLSGKWYNVLTDYVEYMLKAFNKLTDNELEQIKELWG
jgi:hypothetical protein